MKTAIEWLIDQLTESGKYPFILMEDVVSINKAKEMEKQQREEVDKLLHEIEMDEYLNEDTLPKVRKAREILQQTI
jgi:hypothetical protein